MKLRSALVPALSLVLMASSPILRADGLQPDDLVAICGDSITEQKLYSVFMEDYLLMCQPRPSLEAMQFGWSGETSWGFLARMENDLLPFHPTVATTCYGMNDGGYGPMSSERGSKYREAMTGIVRTLQKNGVHFIVVGSPGVVDTQTFKKNPAVYNQTLAELGAIAKEVAEKNGAAFANVHAVMEEVMTKAKQKYGADYHVAGGDGVHPAPNGHLVMAYAFLKALGCSGDIGTITLDWKTGQAEATSGHKVLAAANGKIEVESTKYPFCFFGNPSDPGSTRGIIEFLPFNHELNRFMLVLHNAPSGSLKVSWGSITREFSSTDLEKGINLADEFPDNPFCPAFSAVESIIKKQQAFETPATKSMMHSLADWRNQFPDGEETYKKMSEQIVQKARALRAESAAAVKPVKHTIIVSANQ